MDYGILCREISETNLDVQTWRFNNFSVFFFLLLEPRLFAVWCRRRRPGGASLLSDGRNKKKQKRRQKKKETTRDGRINKEWKDQKNQKIESKTTANRLLFWQQQQQKKAPEFLADALACCAVNCISFVFLFEFFFSSSSSSNGRAGRRSHKKFKEKECYYHRAKNRT